MSYGLQAWNGLGEIVVDTTGGPLFSRVRTTTISQDRSANIGGVTHYGYDWRTTGGASLQANDEIRFVQLPNINDWVCFFGWEIRVQAQFPFPIDERNRFHRQWLISNRPSLTIHTFRPVDSLPTPPAGTYGVSVFNNAGSRVWDTTALLARISGSFYTLPTSDGDTYINNKVWGNITDPFGVGENLVNVNPTNLFFSENSSNPTFLQSVVARRTTNTNIQIRNQRVDRIDFPIDFGSRPSSINALTGTG